MIEHQSVINIPGNVESTVLSFTNLSTDKYIKLMGIEGSARSEWFVYINTNKKLKRRTSVSEPSLGIDMYNFKLAVNDILHIKVKHYESNLQDFNAEVRSQMEH